MCASTWTRKSRCNKKLATKNKNKSSTYLNKCLMCTNMRPSASVITRWSFVTICSLFFLWWSTANENDWEEHTYDLARNDVQIWDRRSKAIFSRCRLRSRCAVPCQESFQRHFDLHFFWHIFLSMQVWTSLVCMHKIDWDWPRLFASCRIQTQKNANA